MEKSDHLLSIVAIVWLIRPLVKDENDEDNNNGKGVLSHAEDMGFMEMAGKKMYSKDLGPDPDTDSNNSSDNDDDQ